MPLFSQTQVASSPRVGGVRQPCFSAKLFGGVHHLKVSRRGRDMACGARAARHRAGVGLRQTFREKSADAGNSADSGPNMGRGKRSRSSRASAVALLSLSTDPSAPKRLPQGLAASLVAAAAETATRLRNELDGRLDVQEPWLNPIWRALDDRIDYLQHSAHNDGLSSSEISDESELLLAMQTKFETYEFALAMPELELLHACLGTYRREGELDEQRTALVDEIRLSVRGMLRVQPLAA